ncbi:hypothetical protein M514_21299 [Trichuris suis]|uniref:Uncharacterized protein n=1 Tax=Trichuris suis TaxID=68888 RepID=A0A085NAF9_9BILA|nr:hypothetical protein M514_21299 [Trichuris suis]
MGADDTTKRLKPYLQSFLCSHNVRIMYIRTMNASLPKWEVRSEGREKRSLTEENDQERRKERCYSARERSAQLNTRRRNKHIHPKREKIKRMPNLHVTSGV